MSRWIEAGGPPGLSRRRAVKALGWLTVGILAGRLPLARAGSTPRLLSVGGALTEIVYALGAQAELVGVDTTSQYPAAARSLPSVGYQRALSAEGILALTPTLVIATEDAGPAIVLQQVRNAGVPVEVLRANHRFEGMLARVQRIGEFSGRTEAAAVLVADLQRQWEQTLAVVGNGKQSGLRLLFCLAHAPNQLMVAGADTGADAMIQYAGGTNAISGFKGYKPLTPEAAIAARPDVVILAEQGVQTDGSADPVLQLPGFDQTPAGKYRRAVAMDAMFLLGFGPRLPAAVAALHAALAKAMA